MSHALVPARAVPQVGARAQAVLRAGSKSFALAATLLPADSRVDAAILYAWCRRVDDAIDLSPAPQQMTRLQQLEEELGKLYARPLRAPTEDLAALGQLWQRRAIPLAYPAELLRGMAMDVAARRYETLDDLLEYAWCVAGVIGVMMCHVMGVDDPSARRHASHLGIAMQLTNIARDVCEDAMRGRLYVPRSWLSPQALRALDEQGAGAPSIEVAAQLRGPVARLLREADRFYRSAEKGMRALPPRAAFGVRVARHVYAAIGDRVAARDHDVLAPRAVVSRPRKLWLVAKAALEEIAQRHTRVKPWRRCALDDVLRFPDDVLPC